MLIHPKVTQLLPQGSECGLVWAGPRQSDYDKTSGAIDLRECEYVFAQYLDILYQHGIDVSTDFIIFGSLVSSTKYLRVSADLCVPLKGDTQK